MKLLHPLCAMLALSGLLLSAPVLAQSPKGPVIVNQPSAVPTPVQPKNPLYPSQKPAPVQADLSVDTTEYTEEIKAYTALKAQRKTSEILSNLSAIKKHCNLPNSVADRVGPMKAQFPSLVGQDLLTMHFRQNLEFGLSLGIEKKSKGITAACEPASYFVDTVSELSTDLNRALLFKEFCASVYESKKLTEILNGFRPLEKFISNETLRADYEAQEKNRITYCNANEEQNFKFKLLQSAMQINTKLFILDGSETQ